MCDLGKVTALSAFHSSLFPHFNSDQQILLYIYSMWGTVKAFLKRMGDVSSQEKMQTAADVGIGESRI